MAHALRISRIGVLPLTLVRVVDAALRAGFDACTRERQDDRQQAGPLDVVAMRDIGASREYQDYASAASVSAARRLHRIADTTRCGLTR